LGFFVFAWTDDTGGNKMIAAINLTTNRLSDPLLDITHTILAETKLSPGVWSIRESCAGEFTRTRKQEVKKYYDQCALAATLLFGVPPLGGLLFKLPAKKTTRLKAVLQTG
jgi:hypothetical protein